MLQPKYASTLEDVKKNSRKLVRQFKADSTTSGIADIGWFNTDETRSFYTLGDFTAVSAKEIRHMARRYKHWYEIEKNFGSLSDDYEDNTLIDMVDLLYDCGLSLNSSAPLLDVEDSLVNPSRYPMMYLPLRDELSQKLLSHDIIYVGEFLNLPLEKPFLTFDEMREIYEQIVACVGAKVVEKRIKYIEDTINELMNQKLMLELVQHEVEKRHSLLPF